MQLAKTKAIDIIETLKGVEGGLISPYDLRDVIEYLERKLEEESAPQKRAKDRPRPTRFCHCGDLIVAGSLSKSCGVRGCLNVPG